MLNHHANMEFPQKIKNIIQQHFPDGEVKVKITPGLKQPLQDIHIVFTLWPRKDWPNGISNNDPAYHQIWVWGAYDKEGALSPEMSLELSVGGVLYGRNATRLTKIGWRNVKGDAKTVLRTLDRYFGQKLKSAVAEHATELEKGRSKTGNVREAYLREEIVKLAHQTPELRAYLIPILNGTGR